MSCAELVEVTELEKTFALSPVPEIQIPTEAVIQPKKKRIRECADLRNFWDDECERGCESVPA